jgi:hypothetical protein
MDQAPLDLFNPQAQDAGSLESCARLRLSCPICFKAGPGRGPCGSAVVGQVQWQQPTTNARLICDRN